jgi:pyruvate,water dikinase
MSSEYILPLADPHATLDVAGGKGASLARLAQAGLPVPAGFHVTTAAYRRFVHNNDLQPRILAVVQVADLAQPSTLEAASRAIDELFAQATIPQPVADAIVRAYVALSQQPLPVAVRSSATAEDLPELSFAGQQATFLNVRGAEAVLEAVKHCWASLWTARAIGYRTQHDIDHDAVSLAVVVQQLVNAEASGVLFTANPINGQRDEAVINATWGLGEAIVGGLVTPDTITLNKATGQLLQRDIADKQVITVRIAEGTREQATPENLRRAPALDDATAIELMRLGVQIEQLYQTPMDIEWVLTSPPASLPTASRPAAARTREGGGRLAIVQARPITALPEPEVPLPTKWKRPTGCYAAMRNNIVELMTEPLTPLFDTLGRSCVNASMSRVMTEFMGRPDILPAEAIISVNGYAYYNGSLGLRQIGFVLLHSMGIARRMFRGAEAQWQMARPRYAAMVERWESIGWRDRAGAEILSGVRELMEGAIDAFCALAYGILPGAWISEALFTFVYRFIKQHDDPSAPTYLLGYNSVPIQAEKGLYDLAEWVRPHSDLAAYLSHTPSTQLAAQLDSEQIPAGVNSADWREWQSRFSAHLRRYGHAIYNLDFANPVPADDPTPLLDTCKMFINGQGTNPHERQQAAADRREQATQTMLARLKGWRLKLFGKYVAAAQHYAPLREDGLADIGLSYPLLRQMLRELGRRFTASGLIEQPDDIFWLMQDEVEQAVARLDCGETVKSLSALILPRKAAWRAAQRVTPPMMLPHMKTIEKMKMARKRRGSKDSLKGVAASPGRVTATARVLNGPEDFDQMQAGDVLVASITTPAWTPLFARAAGVVTDVGGPLSHGSIVAREYGIPAVLGTGVATTRIHSGQIITVDGTSGRVMLPSKNGDSPTSAAKAEGTASEDASSPIEWKLPNPKGVYMRSSVVDLTPKPLSPLFISLGILALRKQMIPLGKQLTRSTPVLPDDYYTSINSYAYMNATLPARSWWWVVTGLLFSYPRLLRIMVSFWRDELLPEYQAFVARQQDKAPVTMTVDELWRGVQTMADAAMRYVVGLLFATMGASAGSELLLTKAYDKLAKRDGDPPATVLLMGWNNIPMRAEKSLYDMAMWCRERETLAAYVLTTPSKQIVGQLAGGQSPVGISADDWQELHARLAQHLEQFGYIVFQLDFAEPLPLDDPAPMLENIKLYLRGEGVNPHERQQINEAKRVQTTDTMLKRLRGLKRWTFRKALNWGQSLGEVREDALAQIGLGYPLLRALLHELGQRFAAADAIREADDIYYLERDEIDQGVRRLQSSTTLDDLSDRVEERKAFLEKAAQVTPPPMMPMKKRVMGVKTEVFVAATGESQTGDTLKGVATSAGKVTAPARVLRGPEDFDQMRPGDVLVAGTTTPAWTPLFAMASAVVTDIGGPLSHGSIVAREYGIPAVMGTGVATRRIRSGQLITVDGSAGTVRLSA